jgi:hypothetical protein
MHPLGGATGAHRLNEQLLGVDRSIGLERGDEVRSDGGAQDVLAVAPGAVQVVLLPSIINLLRDRIPRGLVVLVAELLSDCLGGQNRPTDDCG